MLPVSMQLIRYAGRLHLRFDRFCCTDIIPQRMLTASALVLQVSLHVITMAFVVVLCTCGLLIPVMLYVFQVSTQPPQHLSTTKYWPGRG